MHNKRGLFLIISTVIVISLLYTPSLGSSSNIANAQSSPCDNGKIISSPSSNVLPVLLIHGYAEPSSVWLEWVHLLTQDNIPFCTISFHQSSDECGSAIDHAIELAQIVKQVQSMTGQNKVNIVAHSKGGLDARVYLDNANNTNVANLIMIGTPNAGSPLAFSNNICSPAVFDIRPGATDLDAGENKNTKYFTIAGDWNPIFFNCTFQAFDFPLYHLLLPLFGPNDAFVPIDSVESQQYFINLKHTEHCHQDLLQNEEYELAQPILIGSP